MPAWWGGAADAVLAPPELEADARWLEREYGLQPQIWRGQAVDRVEPWGWSADAVRQFEAAGVPSAQLPDAAAIERMRQLSHRRSSIRLLEALQWSGPHPVELTDADELVRLEGVHPGCFVKTPWSGSGRGVFCASTLHTAALRRRAEGIIHRQGSVMLERGFDCVADFAALYQATDSGVKFTDWSLFFTESMGTYCGNVVAPQSFILEHLSRFVPDAELIHTASQLQQALTELIGDSYRGPLGIDMMIYRDPAAGYALHPCIELNLRCTMGVVAANVARRLSPSKPMLMNWLHAPQQRPAATDTLLLPPREGFALCLIELIR